MGKKFLEQTVGYSVTGYEWNKNLANFLCNLGFFYDAFPVFKDNCSFLQL